MTQGFGGFILHLRADEGCGESVGRVWQVVVLGLDESFFVCKSE